jgi:hypothetical protein
MIVEIAIPELSLYPNGFPDYWLNMLFRGSMPNIYKVKVLVTTYVRLVEGAYTHYRVARSHVEAFWNAHSSLALGSAIISTTYFEDCINSMHRAVLFMRRIRSNRDVPADLKSLFPKKPQFATEAVAKRLRDIRGAIQHMDDRVLNGNIPKDTPFALMATGPETPVLDQPNQTLKVIDRLTLGSDEILFTDLVTWLHEMGKCAEIISKYEYLK